jgi:predicted helicase
MKDYLHNLNDKLRQGDATEHTFRPVLESLLQRLSKDSVVTNEPKRIKVGAPDFVIRRKIGKTQFLPIGYIETKDIGVDLAKLEKDDQISRYLKLENLLFTDYVTFRWYVDGKFRAEAVLAQREKGKLKPLKDGSEKVEELIRLFLSHEPLPITKPEELAWRMAALCKQIDRIIVQSFDAKEASELLSGLKEAFERTLLPDLTEVQFADMFTQTLAYGLFAARIHHYNSPSVHGGAKGGEFRRSEAAKEIPKTNPFLRKLFDTINSTEIEDEPFIGFVDDLTAIMNHADIASILQFFGKRTGQEDPIVHFYETFLAAYDPKLRELRGVYYTPEPVVSYIVRSVDILLKEKFGLKDGLADRSTIEVEVEENGQKVKKTMPRVLILDPACGTGTFLYHVIKLIRQRFMDSNNAGEWSDFVQNHLLPRIYGFELLMAPYAVAHLKLAMQLAGQDLDEPQRGQYAYDFSGSERLNVYMTNSLEMTEKTVQMAMFGLEKQIAEEANAARAVKTELPILVVMGNPPYSGNSANTGRWIMDLVREEYYPNDDIIEKNPKLLLDDYVKFLRFGQWRIKRSGHGILAFITNHSYMDNPTFRRLRSSLLDEFDQVMILDLHGNSKKKEKGPGGIKDENVFDIQQGVAISFFLKNAPLMGITAFHTSDLFGKRGEKYAYLNRNSVLDTFWHTVKPTPPFYLYRVRSGDYEFEYNNYTSITNIFPKGSTGAKTHRDHLVIDFDTQRLLQRIQDFRDNKISNDKIESLYNLSSKTNWNLGQRRVALAKVNNWKEWLTTCLFHPFDTRAYYSHELVVDRPRYEIMKHMDGSQNLGLVVSRQVVSDFKHVFCSRETVAVNVLDSAGSFGSGYLMPLYISNENETILNLSDDFISRLVEILKLNFIEIGSGNLKKTFGPEDIFNYIYAIFHSPTYRKRYAEFLKIDFPRVPLTSNVEMFRKLAALGSELVTLHLVEFELPAGQQTRGLSPLPPAVSYPVKGDHIVEKVQYVDTKQQVWINKTQYFEGVPPEVWEFHIGGYQVAEKWLKDRKGRALTSEDREHYRKIIFALSETIRLMAKIDAAIPAWPIE